MPRGIQNVTGVSCHVSCALQVLSHTVPPLTRALHEVVQTHTKSLVVQLGHVLHSLQSDGEALDPSLLYQLLERQAKMDTNDVGDISTALYRILQAVSQQSSTWSSLVQELFHGSSHQRIRGIKKDGETLVRTKIGKTKRMACPFPVVGSFETLEEALEGTIRSTMVEGYNWEGQKPENYQEERHEQSEDLPSDVGNGWTTTKWMQLERLPRYWMIGLERFSYSSDGTKSLSNPSVRIPKEIESSKFAQADSGSLFLRGGVLHVSDDGCIEEEGHYVTIVFDQPSAQWFCIDDENCQVMEEELALKLLSGEEQDGKFYCATLLAYGQEEADPELNSLVRTLIREAMEEESTPESGPMDLVGRRLKVRWAKGKFYAGIVESYDEGSDKHRVRYDDGDVKDYCLAKKTIEWLD